MSKIRDTSRCWLCDNAIWLFPIWTWSVVSITGLLTVDVLRPPSMVAWLALMGLLLIPISGCIAVFMTERSLDRDHYGRADDRVSPMSADVPPSRRSR